MTNKRLITGLLLLQVLSANHLLAAPATVATAPRPQVAQSHDERMAWWRDARFGMFVHWGVYAIPAGEWEGEQVEHGGEWIMNKAPISVEDYHPLAARFNPQKYDPARWAQVAQDAGMKYLVITSKHHDGFCLFDTATTDWDIVDATPFGKDLLKPLAEECRKRGIRFCTYYSILDWTHPSLQTKPVKKAEYVADMKRQLHELLDSCDPDVLWFDGEWVPWWTEADGRDLYDYLLELKPSLIVNNRVGKGRKGMEGLNRGDQAYAGDFGTPEQQIPATGVPGVDWESCMTMNRTWGFKSYDHEWKSTERLTRNLIDIASKGGNFLLNVGPTAAGEIPEPSIERLTQMGHWMERYSESIYGTEASPIEPPVWGRCTLKKTGAGYTLYLHVFDWPTDGKLTLPKLDQEPLGCRLVETDAELSNRQTNSGLEIDVPTAAPNEIASVIRVDFASRPTAETP